MDRNKKRYTLVLIRVGFKGSYTIEASLLMPLILGVLVILIYLSFLMHDRAVLSAAAYETALRGTQIGQRDSPGRYARTIEIGQELIKGKLLAVSDVKSKVSISGDRIQVIFTGNVNIPGFVFVKIFSNTENVVITGKGSARIQDPSGFIRKIKRLLELKENAEQ